METTVISFSEAIAKAEGKKRLILGNGFSMAWKSDIFAYNALLDEADFSSVSPCVRQAFNLFETQDFEVIIRKLYDAAKVLSLYDGESKKRSKQIIKDADTLKEILAKVIAGKHPSRPNEISEGQYKACARFLSHFEKIYTLNYDLLLYWTLIHDMEWNKLITSINDGFVMPEEGQQEYVTWDSSYSNQQNVFYLHGGLHVFDAGTEFKKLTYCNTQIPLMDQIKNALDNNLYPHFVAEGTSNEKLERIVHSIFLNKGFKSLEGIGGDLFVYGHSLAENDDHVLQIIENGKIENLFISLYGGIDSKVNKKVVARAEQMKDNRKLNIKNKSENKRRHKSKSKTLRSEAKELNIYFFDAQSANVWG